MNRKFRIFISSTMKDLPRERNAVARLLEDFNFEPVMAETLPSSPVPTWETLQPVIASCDIVVTVLGERYGWIPDKGPQAPQKRSVTQLEVEEAKSLGIPVLPFLKKLPEDASRRTADARRREKFREQIRDYVEGHFTAVEFKSPGDLAKQVGRAVVNLVTDDAWRERLRARSDEAGRNASKLTQAQPARPRAHAPAAPPHIPSALARAVAERRAVLFAGSGFSLPAGLPSALAFGERIREAVRESEPTYEGGHIGSALAGLATDLETVRGRNSLVRAVVGLTGLPHVEPTAAHRRAVGLFDYIVTTNYDMLFEKAAAEVKAGRRFVFNELDAPRLDPGSVVKFHGSVDEADSLLLTERDILTMDATRPNLWQAVVSLLAERPVVAVGSSLRDPSIIRLFAQAGGRVPGYFVAPGFEKITPARLRAWNLECIESDADGFFEALAGAVGGK